MTPRALAVLAALVPAACVAMTQPGTPGAPIVQPLLPTERPALVFTIWPASEAEGTAGHSYHAVAVFVAAIETDRGRHAFYRVTVLGLAGDLLVSVPTDL